MANRTLTPAERAIAKKVFDSIEKKLANLAGKDKNLIFAFRRKISRSLIEKEKGTVAEHNRLKKEKWSENNGRCEYGKHKMPTLRGAVLHRHEAMRGYTARNTILICPKCHDEIHTKVGYH